MNIYGVKGYLTPDNLPEDRHCRTFKIPNDVQWLSVFMGALLPLIYSENWQEYGELTPDEAADEMLAVIWDGYNNNDCPAPIEAPYWDDGTDVETVSPEDDQPWYGELVETMGGMGAAEPTLTFFEELRLWAIVGFVAIAGTPAAAIAFAPFARKFVLAFKTGTAGAIVRVFFDGLHLADIDTYGVEDKIIEFLVDVGVEPSGEEMWVEHSGEHNEAATPNENGDYTIQVVRKQLAPDEFSPTNLRYNPDTNTVQQTYDGGDTWVDNPGQDPRHSTTYQYPPVGGDDPRCQAAANQVRFLNNTIDETLSAIALGTDALGLALTLLPLFVELGPFAILFELVLALADGLVSLGADAISSAFTNDVYDQLLCIFFCNIESDGTVTPTDLSNIEDQIGSQIGGVVQVVLDLMLALTGEVGLTNEGTMGDAPADCSDCDCCISPTVEDVPFQNFPAIPVGIFLSYNQVPGQGGLWYADAEGDGGTWTMTLDHAVEIRGVGFNCNSYSGAKMTVTIGSQSTELDYGGIVGWTLDSPYPVTDTITVVQSSVASNIRLSLNGFQVTYCEPDA